MNNITFFALGTAALLSGFLFFEHKVFFVLGMLMGSITALEILRGRL